MRDAGRILQGRFEDDSRASWRRRAGGSSRRARLGRWGSASAGAPAGGPGRRSRAATASWSVQPARLHGFMIKPFVGLHLHPAPQRAAPSSGDPRAPAASSERCHRHEHPATAKPAATLRNSPRRDRRCLCPHRPPRPAPHEAPLPEPPRQPSPSSLLSFSPPNEPWLGSSAAGAIPDSRLRRR